QSLRVEVDAGEHRLLRPRDADMPHQRARIDTLETDDACAFEVFAQRHLGAPVRRTRNVFLDDEALDVDAGRLLVFAIDPDVADLRIGHAHHLALVGRVSEHFLVAGHRRVEDYFADRLTDRTDD